MNWVFRNLKKSNLQEIHVEILLRPHKNQSLKCLKQSLNQFSLPYDLESIYN